MGLPHKKLLCQLVYYCFHMNRIQRECLLYPCKDHRTLALQGFA
jgi:hypothetical protein